MAVKNNPELGKIDCGGCNGVASVHQTQRGKSRYLYTRCIECGPDQRTGKSVQSRLWNNTKWMDGAPENAPPGVEAAPDWQPKQPEKEPSGEPSKEPKEPKRGGLFAVLALVLGGGALVLAARKGGGNG